MPHDLESTLGKMARVLTGQYGVTVAFSPDGPRAEHGRIVIPEFEVSDDLARDTVEPSPLSHELINANPYAFLDDAPLEERRTRAVQLRRGLPAETAQHHGALDADAISLAAEEVAPTVRDADELHDALLGMWAIPEAMADEAWAHWF